MKERRSHSQRLIDPATTIPIARDNNTRRRNQPKFWRSSRNDVTSRRNTNTTNSSRPFFFAFILLVIVTCWFLNSSSIQNNHQQQDESQQHNIRSSSSLSTNSECWLKDAYKRGEFTIFSHRSFVNHNNKNNAKEKELFVSNKMSCQEALQQLHTLGISHLDLDLVYAPPPSQGDGNPVLLVSHPMEYKGTTNYYSPCALTPLSTLIDLLDDTFSNREDWFISLEPKAHWGRADAEMSDPALASPIQIMTVLLEVLTKHNLTRKQCAIIIDTNQIANKEEEQIVRKILETKICQLYGGIRLADGVMKSMMRNGFEYDVLMQTIEFHPGYHDTTNTGVVSTTDNMMMTEQIAKKTLFWVVDNAKHLKMAADFHPLGIVSNNPADIVALIHDPMWCPSSTG